MLLSRVNKCFPRFDYKPDDTRSPGQRGCHMHKKHVHAHHQVCHKYCDGRHHCYKPHHNTHCFAFGRQPYVSDGDLKDFKFEFITFHTTYETSEFYEFSISRELLLTFPVLASDTKLFQVESRKPLFALNVLRGFVEFSISIRVSTEVEAWKKLKP
uniref:Uncharacterized protein n=1 Tax=Glossina austeni TaxID=7395 RepID=A0A1A9V6R2_GLOAU